MPGGGDHYGFRKPMKKLKGLISMWKGFFWVFFLRFFVLFFEFWWFSGFLASQGSKIIGF